MKNKILIFSPTYNESENIIKLLNLTDQLNLNADILIIDDNSPDGTWKIVQDYSKNKKNIHLIIRDKKRGLDTAHKLAYEYSLSNNYELLITLELKANIPPHSSIFPTNERIYAIASIIPLEDTSNAS